MLADGEPVYPPSRAEVRAKLSALMVNDLSREEISDWATQWVRLRNPNVADPLVWEALTRLSGADLRNAPDEYLHTGVDFAAWLEDFDRE